jgi:hypothetical protein
MLLNNFLLVVYIIAAIAGFLNGLLQGDDR